MSHEFTLIQRFWRGLAGLHVLLLVHLILYTASPDKGNSAAFHLLAGGTAGFSLAAILFALALTPARLESLRRWFRPLRWIALGSGVLVLFAFGLSIRPEWIYAHIVLMAAATLALGFWTLYGGAEPLPHPRLWLALGALIILAVIAVRVYGLADYPSIQYNDEPWDLGWAYSYAQTGHLSDWIFLGNEGFEGKTYYWIPRFYAVYGLWLKLVGVGLWEARLFTFGLVLITTVFGALAARNLYGRTTGLLAGGVLFASAGLMVGARIRHDIGLALAMTVSLWLYSAAVKNSITQGVEDADKNKMKKVSALSAFSAVKKPSTLHLLAGMVMGWGMFAHYHATGFAVVLTLGFYGPRYLARWREGQRWPERGFWLYVLGGLLGALTVAIFQIFPDVDGFRRYRNPRSPESSAQFFDALRGYINNIARFSRIELTLSAAGLIAALWRRRPADQILAVIGLLGPVALAYMARTPFDQLIVPLMPFYGILIAALFSHALTRSKGEVPRLQTVTAAVFLLFLAPQLGLTLKAPLTALRGGEPVRPEPPPFIQWVYDHVPPGSTVCGENYHFFWLTDYRFVAPRTASHLTRAEEAKYESVDAIWDAIGVDAFIYDPSVGTFGVLTPLRKNGYLESRGYEQVAKIPYYRTQVTIFRRSQ
jgi:4-amino-4-deoxy-L-arabinose transferase-like glycosyltransferase